ncbi:hypothetical protein [Paenibacillus sp. MABNR03]|uniref:hypothetical protein n=1 Tax=Paenibacillus sp. MABNR03 TaxID=3142626 RepID=UPI003D280F08
MFSYFLQKNTNRTVIIYPIIFLITYGLLVLSGNYTTMTIIIVFIWGTVHSAGFLLSQTWLGTETQDAPEFGNSLYLSFANLGITLGSAIGGWFISQFGIGSLLFSGILFAIIAFISVLTKLTFAKKRIFSSNSCN